MQKRYNSIANTLELLSFALSLRYHVTKALYLQKYTLEDKKCDKC